MRVDETSKAVMMGALGIVPLKKEDADKKPAAKEDGADGAIWLPGICFCPFLDKFE